MRALRNVTANAAWETVAWAELELGDVDRACTTLGRVRPAVDVSRYCLAAFPGEAFVEATRLAGELYAMTLDPADASSHPYGLAHLGQELSRLTRSSVS